MVARERTAMMSKRILTVESGLVGLVCSVCLVENEIESCVLLAVKAVE